MLDPDRARDDEHSHRVGHRSPLEHLRNCPQILDAPIRAGADEDGVHGDVPQGHPRREPHVLKGALDGDSVDIVLRVRGRRNGRREGQPLPRIGSPGHEGTERRSVDRDLGVEHGVVVGMQARPVGDCLVPLLPLRGTILAAQEVERRLIRSDHARAGTGLDRHIADRHTPFHRQGADRGPAVLEDIALTAAGADAGDDGQDDVLCGHPCRQLAFDIDRHRLERLQRQCLRRQHVLDLARTDAECKRTECPVRGCVRVAADDRHAGLGKAKLRSDDVHDTLFDVAERVQGNTELGTVRAQRLELRPRDRVGNRLVDVCGRNVVILRGEREIGAPHRSTGIAQAVEGLCARHLMDEVQIDVQQVRLAVGTANDVRIPDLLRQCASHRILHSIA